MAESCPFWRRAGRFSTTFDTMFFKTERDVPLLAQQCKQSPATFTDVYLPKFACLALMQGCCAHHDPDLRTCI